MTSVTAWQKAFRSADLPLATKGVLLMLSGYADWTKGDHIRPGERIQTECGIPRKTAYRHIKAGVEAGWLVQTCHGSTAPKRNMANEYRLAIPDHVQDAEGASTDHGSSVTHDREEATDHGSSVSTMGHPWDDHGSPVTPHLTSPSHNHLVDIDEPHSGEDRATARVRDRSRGFPLSRPILDLLAEGGSDRRSLLRRLGGNHGRNVQLALNALVYDGKVTRKGDDDLDAFYFLADEVAA